MFQNFDKQTAESWQNKIITDLKGGDYNALLEWNSVEGVKVEPFYTKEHLKGDYQSVFKHTDWEITQEFFLKTEKESNKEILDSLMKGVNTVLLNLSSYSKSEIDFNSLLDGLVLDSISIIVEIKENQISLLENLIEFCKQKISLDKLNLRAKYNVLDSYFTSGDIKLNSFLDSIKLVQKKYPNKNIKLLSVDLIYLQNAGSSIENQLANTLCQLQNIVGNIGAEYLNNTAFYYSVSSNYFFEIAKLRSARKLISFLFDAYKIEDAPFIYVENSIRNKTVFDPYVNMLRTGSETLASALGGANAILTKPFDSVFAEPTEFSLRIARNQQIILKGESYIGTVADPASGAYYIETLTTIFEEKAYALFQEIEELGFEKYLADIFPSKIAEMQKNYSELYKELELPLLGTNLYPNKEEQMQTDIEKDIKPFANNFIPSTRISLEDELARLETEKA